MAPLANKRQNKQQIKSRKTKTNLVFDEEKRREFLGGFHKRKLQRKKEAQETLEKKLKEEKKRLKHDAKESYKKLVVSARPIPDLEEMFSHEYETDNVTVKVTELSDAEIARQNCWIGPNQPLYETSQETEDVASEEEIEEIVGMQIKNKPTQKEKKDDTQHFKTERDVKRALKKKATKNVQKSKPFQMKIKLEQRKNKKKSLQKKKLTMKLQNKQARKRGTGKGKTQ